MFGRDRRQSGDRRGGGVQAGSSAGGPPGSPAVAPWDRAAAAGSRGGVRGAGGFVSLAFFFAGGRFRWRIARCVGRRSVERCQDA